MKAPGLVRLSHHTAVRILSKSPYMHYVWHSAGLQCMPELSMIAPSTGRPPFAALSDLYVV